jgi:hypothetical protein
VRKAEGVLRERRLQRERTVSGEDVRTIDTEDAMRDVYVVVKLQYDTHTAE